MALILTDLNNVTFYTFPSGFDLHSWDDHDFQARSKLIDRFGRHGANQVSDRAIKPRKVTIRGAYHAADQPALKAFLDELQQALHYNGEPYRFSWETGYYINVSHVGSFKSPRHEKGLAYKSINIIIEFVCPDPFWYSITPSSVGPITISSSPQTIPFSTDGQLTHVDSDDQGDNAYAVWGDGDFIYLANFNGGLHVYSVDGAGNLTHVDSDDPAGVARCVWGDGNFIYLANGTGGLHVYSVDGAGNLTHIDSDAWGNYAIGVWGDGNFIYVAYDPGLYVYSVDGSGNLTRIDSDDPGGLAVGVWGDGNFIYLANNTTGLHVYSVDGSGILTHIDSDDQGDNATKVWGDGNFIYLGNGAGGLHTYSVDGAGALTHIGFNDQGDAAVDVWGDGNFIYLANSYGGLHVYSVDGAGALTHICFNDQVDAAYGVWGDGNFIYLANNTGGLHVYRVGGGVAPSPLKIQCDPTAAWGDFTIENDTDDDNLCRYADPNFGNGDQLIIDAADGKVERDSLNTVRYFSGAFLRVLPGDNSIIYTGPTGGTITLTAPKRFL